MHLYDPLFHRKGRINFGKKKKKTVSSLPLALVMIKTASLMDYLMQKDSFGDFSLCVRLSPQPEFGYGVVGHGMRAV